MDQNNYQIVKCPHCQYNYVPAEVMHPNDFLGKPCSILRDALGKIIYHEYEEGNEPAQVETYICDGCDKQFVIEPVITYRAKKEIKELDFTETTVSLLDD